MLYQLKIVLNLVSWEADSTLCIVFFTEFAPIKVSPKWSKAFIVFSELVSSWCYGSILVSYTRGSRFEHSFYQKLSLNSVKTFEKNSIVSPSVVGTGQFLCFTLTTRESWVSHLVTLGLRN